MGFINKYKEKSIQSNSYIPGVPNCSSNETTSVTNIRLDLQ